MATVRFTSALKRFLAAPPAEVAGATVGAALAAVFEARPALRGYVLDDQGALRRRVAAGAGGARVSAEAGGCRRRPASLVPRQNLGHRAGWCPRAVVGRDDAGRALPLRRWRRVLVVERAAVVYARTPAMAGRRRRRAARHQLGADRPA